MTEAIDMSGWYSASQAAEVLTRNSRTLVKPAYLRQLVLLGKVRTMKIGPRTNLYRKEDIDAYRVEGRGKKSGRAARTRKTAKQDKTAA